MRGQHAAMAALTRSTIPRALRLSRIAAVVFGVTLASATATATATATAADASLAPELALQLQHMASQSATAASTTVPGARVEVELGRIDPRLNLAPCARIEPYLPTGVRPLGRSRVGLRCIEGAVRWNVYLPVTVRLFAPAWVARQALAEGTVLQPAHLMQAEVDLAASADPAYTNAAPAIGRALARPLLAGQALRRSDLRARQFFQAGELVRVVAVGAGYAISVDAHAVSPGVEGQPARVRTESGRILSGMPTAGRRVEVTL